MFQLCACHSDIPQYNSSETFRNVPLLLSHVCPAALSFDGYALSDRKSIIADKIGNNCAKDMLWGKFSVLQKYADAKGTIHDVQTSVLRDIAQKADLHTLDDISLQYLYLLENVGFTPFLAIYLLIYSIFTPNLSQYFQFGYFFFFLFF